MLISHNICAYTGVGLSSDSRSWDHVFPRFMSGSDSQQVPCDREFNSKIGSIVEGPLSNDIILSYSYVRKGKRDKFKWKNMTAINNNNITGEINFQKGVHSFFVKGKKIDDWQEKYGLINYKMEIRQMPRLFFSLKVFLGVFYRYFGETSHISNTHQYLMTLLKNVVVSGQLPDTFSSDHISFYDFTSNQYRGWEVLAKKLDETMCIVSVFPKSIRVVVLVNDNCLGVTYLNEYDHSPATENLIGQTIIFPCHMKLKGAFSYTHQEAESVFHHLISNK